MIRAIDEMKNKKIYYNDELIKENFSNTWFDSHFREKDLPVENVKNGIILSPLPSINARNCTDTEVGVVDDEGFYIEGSGMKGDKIIDLNIPAKDKIPFIDKKVIYGGNLYYHYGHFLLQSTTRLYYWLKLKKEKIPIVFVSGNKKPPKFIQDFFKLLNMTNDDIIFITEHTKFKEVICPPLSSQYYKDWTYDFILPFQEAAKNICAGKYEKVYFSRKYWNGFLAKCLGEPALEKLFRKNGYKIVYPEKLSLEEQISIVKGAKILAGITGTALHNILFANPGIKLYILSRNAEFNSQYIVNEACEADWYVVKAHSNPLPVTHPDGPFIVGVTDELKEFCNDKDINTFRIKFEPNKFAADFMKIYLDVYSQGYYEKLLARNKVQIVAIDFINLINVSSYSFAKLMIYKLVYKCSFGSFRKKMKEQYNLLKIKSKSRNTVWKY